MMSIYVLVNGLLVTILVLTTALTISALRNKRLQKELQMRQADKQ